MRSKTRKDWVLPFVLLVLIWGLIGLNRNTIGALGPFLRKEFGIDDLELATAAAIFAFTWALGSYFAGLLASRFGTKRIIVGAGLLTSLFGWVACTVGSFVQLIAVQVALGFVEGSVTSPIFTAGRRVVPANMRATVISMFFASFILIGMAGGTALLANIGQEYGWRIGFALAAAPLFLLVLCTAYVFKEPPLEDEASSDRQPEVSMAEAAKSHYDNMKSETYEEQLKEIEKLHDEMRRLYNDISKLEK